MINSFFEQLLLETRGMSLTHAKRNKTFKKLNYSNKLPCWKFLTENASANTILFEILNGHKRQLENFRNEKMKEILLRSRANWIEHGEKRCKYFSS